MQVRARDTKAGPAPLHTPSDLKSNAVRDISGALNILLADMFALYLKTKNFHWHMSGPPMTADFVRWWQVLHDPQLNWLIERAIMGARSVWQSPALARGRS